MSRNQTLFSVLLLLPAVAQAQATSAAPELALELKIAPRMALARPFTTNDYTDATGMSLTFKAKQPISKAFEASMSAGPTVTIDDDKTPPNGSGFGAGLELATRTLGRWKLFASYGLEGRFKGEFDDDNGHEVTVKAGLRYAHNDLPFSFGVKGETAVLRVDSTNEQDDFYGFAGEAGTTNKFLWFAHLTASGGVQRRVYEHPNKVTGTKRRDWQYFGFAGLDFAPLAHAVLRDRPALSKYVGSLTLGYRYATIDSTIPSEEKETHSLVPALIFKTKL